MTLALLVVAALVGDLILAIGVAQLLARTSRPRRPAAQLPAVAIDNRWAKSYPRGTPTSVAV